VHLTAELMTKVAEAAIGMCDVVLGRRPSPGALEARARLVTEQQINAMGHVTGTLEGVLLYSMSVATADKIASQLLGYPVVTFDHRAAAAIGDFSSKLSGSIAGSLLLEGLPVEVSGTEIIRGSSVPVVTPGPALVVPLNIPELGSIFISIALRRLSHAAAA